MAKIQISNPRQTINGGAKKYYFKVKGLGGPKGDRGDKGDTGSRGPQGEPGNAATVYVGSTTTLPVGQDATVENVGTQYNAVLNFGIPQGPRGPQGIQGERGEPGQTGQTGPRGPQGEKGTNATVYVGTTTTTNPGTQARVYNSGTDSNAVLNFEIPRGDVGPQPELVQTTGTSTTKAMSQNATTVALATKQNTIDSSHKLSADLVTDTTTTNKFVTAEDKTTWNAKQNALTAGDNITISGDTISTPAIAPEVVAELPATGAEGKLYLTPKNYTRSTATGNPITATVAEDAGAIESFQLDGDTYQQTYTGKNLLYPNLRSSGTNLNGLTPSYNDATGEITITGTPTESWSNIGANTNISLPAGTYTLSQTGASSTHSVAMYVNHSDNTRTQLFIAPGESSVTVNIAKDVVSYYVYVSQMAIGEQINDTYKMQLESGSTATSYEPFVGGVPSPNPSYPQPIQTVTGEQTVEIVGNNLFDKDDVVNGIPSTSDGTIVSTTSIGRTSGFIRVKSSTNYSHTGHPNGWATIAWYKEDKSFISRIDNATTTTSPTEAAFARVSCASTDLNTCQFEEGQPTDYAPYSHQTLPLNLGSIELCKLGAYQDYIWKDGDDWKVHKATKKVELDEQSGWTKNQYGTNAYKVIEQDISTLQTIVCAASQFFTGVSYDGRTAATQNIVFADSQPGIQASDRGISIRNTPWSDTTSLLAWVASNHIIVYYLLLTPTDTTITDTELIAQLEAIRTASLENGTNTITNSAPAPNLAGDMEIGYYGYNPTNRYDKWLWLDLNNNYEQIGS